MNENIARVLIVGGAGYIGSVLTRVLLDRGYETTVFDRLLFGPRPLAELQDRPGFRLVTGDVRDIGAVSAAVRGQDAVILLAALVGEPACDRNPDETVDINWLGSLAVLEAARRHGVKRLVFASTDSCYGIQEGILTEDSPLNPISLYARLKADLEKRVLGPGAGDLCPVVLRLATVYGLSPRMRFDLIINILTLNAATRGRIQIHGGRQWRPLVHVADVAEGFAGALAAPREAVCGEIFNIGANDQNYQIGALGELVKQRLPETVIETIDQPPDLRDYHVNFDKAGRVLGYASRRTVVQAVDEIAGALGSGAIADPSHPRYRNA